MGNKNLALLSLRELLLTMIQEFQQHRHLKSHEPIRSALVRFVGSHNLQWQSQNLDIFDLVNSIVSASKEAGVDKQMRKTALTMLHNDNYNIVELLIAYLPVSAEQQDLQEIELRKICCP